MKNMKKWLTLVLALALALALCACSGGDKPTDASQDKAEVQAEEKSEEKTDEQAEEQTGYTPGKNVTMFTPYDAGGAVDLLGRNVGAMMTSNGIVDNNFVYENQGGASGQVGLNVVVKQHNGENDLLIPIASTYITLQKIQGDEYGYQDLTVVAQLATDYNLVVVNADSPYQTMDDLIAAGKENELVVAASGTGAISHILAERIKSETGMKARVLPCDGSSEQVVAILGNQVDFSCNNPGEVGQYVESGELRALAVTSPERLEAFPDVPTLIECGIDITESVSRGLAMAPGVSEEARQYWEDRAKELFETEEFQTKYIEANSMTAQFLTGEEYTAQLDEQYAVYEEILTQIGLAK